MNFPLNKFALALAFVVLAACDKATEPQNTQRVAAALAMAPQADAPLRARVVEATGDVALKRHLAVRHELQLQTDADTVEIAYQAAQAACADAGCELLSSQLTRDEDRRPSHASLDVRVPPDKAPALLARLSAVGTVGHHQITSDDKTDEVIDVEARLKNMQGFRDNLRVLMGKSSAKLSDLIEVERELVRVQSELDSLASRRKALAGLTESVRIMLTISARPAVLEAGTWAPLRDALLGATRVFASSLAGLISVLAAAAPWFVLVLVPLGLSARAWRRRRRGAA